MFFFFNILFIFAKFSSIFFSIIIIPTTFILIFFIFLFFNYIPIMFRKLIGQFHEQIPPRNNSIIQIFLTNFPSLEVIRIARINIQISSQIIILNSAFYFLRFNFIENLDSLINSFL